MQEAVNCSQDANLRKQRDEERVDREREASHPLQAQVTSNGDKVSSDPFYRLVLNDMSQFQRLALIHDRLIAARTIFQQRGARGQPGQETEPEPRVTQVGIAVEVQAGGAMEAQAQAGDAAEAWAQARDAAEAQAQAGGGAEAQAQAGGAAEAQAQAEGAAEARVQVGGAAEAQAQAGGAAEARAQATGAAESQAEAMVSAEAPPQAIEGDQFDRQASPFSPLPRGPRLMGFCRSRRMTHQHWKDNVPWRIPT